MAKPDINFRIASALGSLFGPKNEEREVWLNTPNNEFDGFTPNELMKQGGGKILAEYLEDKLLGHPD